MDRDRVETVFYGSTAVFAFIALIALLWGPSEAEVDAAQPYAVQLEAAQPTQAPSTVRPVPRGPQPSPEGALVERENGLKVWDIRPGTGEPARKGQVVRVDYAAWLADGTLADTSFARHDPLRIKIGGKRVIQGLTLGVAEMRKGGHRQLVVPPSLAYGDRGRPGRIPPKASLTYEVTLIDILEVPEAIPAVPGSAWQSRDNGVRVADLVEGTGEPVRDGVRLVMDVTRFADGVRVDSSLEQPAAFPVPIGKGSLMPAWEDALMGLKAGGHRVIELPPDQAYGSEGRAPLIPPDSVITLDVWARRVHVEDTATP